MFNARCFIGMFVAANSLTVLVSGCATLTNGTTQSIPLSSSPARARVIVDGRDEYDLPCVMKLSRAKDHTIVVRAEGCEDQTRHFTRKTSKAFWANIWLGGLIGMAVDGATGACYDLVPEEAHVTLARIEGDKPEAVSSRQGPKGGGFDLRRSQVAAAH